MRHTKREFQASSSIGRTSVTPRSLKSKTAPINFRLNSGDEPKCPSNPYVLFLKPSSIRFNPPSKKESIFFDESNRDIISLTSNVDESRPPNKTLVVCQGTDKLSRIEFVLPIGKKVLAIKFNQTKSVLAYHVERNIVEFINVKQKIPDASASSSSNCESPESKLKYALEDKRYIQGSRAKNSKMIGFLWTGTYEVVIITDLSVEYYHVDHLRRRLNLVKIFQSATNWFVYQPPVSNILHRNVETCDAVETTSPSQCEAGNSCFSLLMVSTGSLGNSIQPYMFNNGRVVKLQKFDVDGNWRESDKLELIERSITVGFIYGFVRLLVLQNESLNLTSKGAQIVLYTIDTESGVTTKTHTLDLNTSGRFAINILDNLVIAHDQPSKTSFIFDIAIQSTEKSDCPNHFVSLIDNRSIRPLEVTDSESQQPAEMYSLNWVFFQPNFIVDAKLGLLCTLQIDLLAMQDVLQDNFLLLTFLAHRSESEGIILNRCKQVVCDAYRQAIGSKLGENSINNQQVPLADVSSAFEILSHVVEPALKISSKSAPSRNENERYEQTTPTRKLPEYPANIQQKDVDCKIFQPLLETTDEDLEQPAAFHFVSSVFIEFIFSIRCRNEKNVDFCIYERLVKCLVRGKRFFQIVQMVRSGILMDSKQLACLLISIKDQYRPAGQLGLDMLHRLPCGLSRSNLIELMQE